MIKVTKKKDFNKLDEITIETEDGKFKIFYGGNLDLYWAYHYFGDNDQPHTFTITKENYVIYELIDELYNNIKNNNIPKKRNFEFEDDFFDDFFNDVIDDDKHQKLFIDDVVTWHSDDCPYETASKLLIFKENEEYKITFIKSKEEFMEFSVRISNSGSRYGEFSTLFMNMYNKLCEYNPEYHQIHMEEYLYNKKVKKLK
ncbi:MAG: hypothetical protein E7157_05280 [Lactobacillales bacterium]|nr:hypothetical protein [Lactobacillales bacterium]